MQPWILAGERPGSQTHIVMTGNASLCVRMKKLTAFLELEAAILDREIRCLAAAHDQKVVGNCEHECASHVRTETTKPLGEFC